MNSTCCRCGESKNIELFVKCSRRKSGYTKRCKECHSRISFCYVKNNPESRRKSYTDYYHKHKEQCFERTKNWAANNPEKVARSRKKTRLVNIEKIRAYTKKNGLRQLRELRAKYPEKFKARNAVNNAVAKGLMPRVGTQLCKNCGDIAREYHHHKGYAQENWLNVVPLCKPCHKD